MESNGMPGRIHCSQATADALTKAGRGDWVTAREGKIEAKGKGVIQTYFVSVAPGAGTSAGKTTVSHASMSTISNGDTGGDVEGRLMERLSRDASGARQ